MNDLKTEIQKMQQTIDKVKCPQLREELAKKIAVLKSQQTVKK